MSSRGNEKENEQRGIKKAFMESLELDQWRDRRRTARGRKRKMEVRKEKWRQRGSMSIGIQ